MAPLAGVELRIITRVFQQSGKRLICRFSPALPMDPTIVGAVNFVHSMTLLSTPALLIYVVRTVSSNVHNS